MYEIVLTQNPHKWTTQMHCSSMEDVCGFLTNETPHYTYLWSVDTTGKYIYGGIVLTNETTHYIIMVEMVSS